jgi:hypothetical protein
LVAVGGLGLAGVVEQQRDAAVRVEAVGQLLGSGGLTAGGGHRGALAVGVVGVVALLGRRAGAAGLELLAGDLVGQADVVDVGTSVGVGPAGSPVGAI